MQSVHAVFEFTLNSIHYFAETCGCYMFLLYSYFHYADRSILMALRCLTLLFAPMKSKKLDDNLPYIMKVVPVSL